MAEVATSDIRANFDILESEVKTAPIDFALRIAIAETKQRIGAATYADLISGTPSDELSAISLEKAVQYLAVSELLKNKFLRFRRGGLVKKEQDAGSPATNQTIINEYLTPSEMQTLSKAFRDDALETLSLAELNTKKDLLLFVNVNQNIDNTVYADFE